MIELKLNSTNYQVTYTSLVYDVTGTLILSNNNVINNLYLNIKKNNIECGNVTYSEYSNNMNNYSYNISNEDKDAVITIMDAIIEHIKNELNANEQN